MMIVILMCVCSAMRMQQQKRAEQAEQTKEQLMQLLKNEILNVDDLNQARAQISDKSKDEVEIVSLAWRKTDENRSLMMGQIQNEFKVNSMKVQAEIEERMRSEMFEKIELAKAELNKQHSIILAAHFERQKAGNETELHLMKDKSSESAVNNITCHDDEILTIKHYHKDEISRLKDDFQNQMKQLSERYEEQITVIKEESEVSLASCKDEGQKMLEEQVIELQKTSTESFQLQIKVLKENLSSAEAARKKTVAELEQMKQIDGANSIEMEKLLEEKGILLSKIEQLKEDRNKEFDRIRDEVKTPLEQEIESLKESQHLMMSSAAETYLEEVEKLKEEIVSTKGHNISINMLVSKHESEKESLRAQLTESFQNEMDQIKLNRQNDQALYKKRIVALKTEKENELESLRNKLEQEFQDEILRVKAEANESLLEEQGRTKSEYEAKLLQMRKSIESMANEVSKEMEKSTNLELILRETTDKHDITIVKLEEKFSSDFKSLRESLNNERVLALSRLQEELNNAHELGLKEVKEKHKNDMAIAFDSKEAEIQLMVDSRKQIEYEYEIRITNLNADVQQIKQELEKSRDDFAREFELGEAGAVEGSQHDVQNLLDNQRSSFDARVVQIKSEHENDIQALQQNALHVQDELETAKHLLQERTVQFEVGAEKTSILENDLMKAHSDIHAAKTREMKLDLSIDKLQEEIRYLDKKYRDDLESKIQEIANLHKSIIKNDQAMQAKAVLITELDSLKTRLSELEVQLAEAEAEKAIAMNCAQTKEDEKEHALQQLRAGLESKDHEIANLHKSIIKKDQAMQASSGLGNELDSLKTRLSELEVQLAEAAVEKVQLTSTIAGVQATDVEQKQMIQKLRDEVVRISEEKANEAVSIKKEYEDKLKEKTLSITVIEDKNQSAIKLLKQEIVENNIDCLDLKKQLDELHKSNAQITEKSVIENEEELRLKQEALSKEVIELRRHIEASSLERDELEALKISANEEIGDLRQTIESLTKSKEDATEQHTQELENLKARVRSGIASYKQEISSLTESLNTVKSVNENQLSELQQMKEHQEKLVCQIQESEYSRKDSMAKEERIVANHEEKILVLQNELEKAELSLEREKGTVKSLEREIDSFEKMHSDSIDGMKADLGRTISSSREEIKNQKLRISQLEEECVVYKGELADSKSSISKLRADLELYQQTERTMKDEISDLEISLNESITNSRSTTTSLIERQEQLENENIKLKHQLSEAKNKEVELRTNFSGLSSRLEALTVSKEKAVEIQSEKSRKSELEFEARILSLTNELARTSEKLTLMKSDQATLENTISRMKIERDASERRHGQRTALVGMLEIQMSEAKDECDRAKSKLDDALSAIDKKESDILLLEKEIDSVRSDLLQTKDALDEAGNRNDASVAIARKDIEVQHRSRLESLQQKMAKKSAAAQKLLQQREQECIELRKANKAMQIELESGSSSDRHIFELAAKVSLL